MKTFELIKILQTMPENADVKITAEGGQVEIEDFIVALSDDGKILYIGE